MSLVEIHEKHWSEFMADAHHRSLYDSWWTPGTVNYWRHTRLLAPVLEVLPGMQNLSWLTIGDGAGTVSTLNFRAEPKSNLQGLSF
jgi:hypothetical protein